MTIKELIEILEEYANQYGGNIPVCTFDLDRDVCDINEVSIFNTHNTNYYVYIGN